MDKQQSTQVALGTVTAFPASAPGHPIVPAGFELVPASIGRPGNVQTVWVQCPRVWCRVNHVENREVAVEDITHYGPGTGMQVPTMTDDTTAVFEWYVNITSDPASEDPRMRAAHLIVADGSADDAHLDDAQAVEFIAELRRLADDVEAALVTVRAANGDSDPDMDEMLRRARGGVA